MYQSGPHPKPGDLRSLHPLDKPRAPLRWGEWGGVVPGLLRDLAVPELDDVLHVRHLVAVVRERLHDEQVPTAGDPPHVCGRWVRIRVLEGAHGVPTHDPFARLRHLHHVVLGPDRVLFLRRELQHTVREQPFQNLTVLSFAHAWTVGPGNLGGHGRPAHRDRSFRPEPTQGRIWGCVTRW